MQRRNIAGTDLECAVILLGGVPLGSTLSEEESFRLMDLYVERGGNCIDSALIYSDWLPVEKSMTEKTIGKWMKSRKNRQQLIVTTKGAHPEFTSMHIPRLSRTEIVSDLEKSLKHLQVDTIDLYWLHRDDESRPVADILETLQDQVKAGKIRYFGCSNWSTSRLVEAQLYAKQNGLQGFSGNQVSWSLASIDQTKVADPTLIFMDDELKRYHTESALPVFAYSSQANGLFTKLHAGVHLLEDERISPMYKLIENKEKYERIQNIAEDRSLSINQVVLGYLLSQPFSVFPIAGSRTVKQLEDSLRAADVLLSRDELSYLEGL